MTENVDDNMELDDHGDLIRLLQAEKQINNNVMSIRMSSDGLVFSDSYQQSENYTRKLPGVYCQGVQYFDLNGLEYINSNGMAILIELLKCLLEINVEVQFVNVSEKIKKRIKEFGLEKIIHCGDRN